ncbi:MAG: UDP-N-acetylmuramoyl-tripeptide--D-alanyl-D-alanine ligase [Paludibacteraceae bacterium]|nr:UDP-N-acetylmuramoyl-tripeptide--D-alanyl-D-alanine ligase [Paludibacteraceae bacterium]
MNITELYRLFLAHPNITTDSRNCPEHAIFFALKGENFDGNGFAEKAIENGASYAVIDNPRYQKDKRFLLVANALETLRELAAYHRRQLHIPVVGITGTNGKTTTKELTAAVLSKKYRTLYTQGNLNNHIGVPLTLLRIKPTHEMVIIEMGANHPGEIKDSVTIVRPTHGIITNVGKAHIEGFGSFDNIVKTKAELYDFLRENGGEIFINKNNDHLNKVAAGLKQHTYAAGNTSANVCGEIGECNPFISVKWQLNNVSYETRTNLIGSYNLENILAAICIGNHFGVAPEAIGEAIGEYIPQNNRSLLTQTEHNRLIVDTYNANPTSMEAALTNFDQMKNFPNKVVLLGDMLELGAESRCEHVRMVKLIEQFHFKAFLVGKEFAAATSKYPVFASIDDFIEWQKQHPITGCSILIKGSHGIHLEKAIPYL